MTAFASPEEAARGGVPEEYVRVVGVVVRGDEAIVAQVMNADGYPDAYERETGTCSRLGDGWACDTGNSNLSWIATSKDSFTVVWWDEAPAEAGAARIRLGQQEQTVPVESGFFFAVFDDVPESVLRPVAPLREAPEGRPRLVEWL